MQQIAVGLCIVLLGTFLVLDRLGVLSAQYTLRYWPVGLILIGLSVILQALVGDRKARSTVPWGAIFWLVVLGVGLTHVFDRQGGASETGSNMSVFAVLGGTNRAAEPDFKSASVTTMMGGARLDLRPARPAPGEELQVDLFTVMGGAVIYAPVEWVVDVQAVSVMGGIADERRTPRRGRRDGDEPQLDIDFPPLPPLPTLPPLPPPAEGAPQPPAGVQPSSPSAPGDTPLEVEAEDTSTGSVPPRLVVRGFVGMGGLTIKSR